jgi:hypothetical protein
MCSVVADSTLILPGFASLQLNSIDQEIAGPDGTTTIIASIPAVTASASLSAPVGLGAYINHFWPIIIAYLTILTVTLFDGPANSEAKFQLGDGSNVDEKCAFNGQMANCTAVVVKGSVTTTQTFDTTLPAGFGGSIASITSGGTVPSDTTVSGAQTTISSGTTVSGAQTTISSGTTASGSQTSGSNTPSGSQSTPSNKPSSASRIGITTSSALVAIGILAGLLL